MMLVLTFQAAVITQPHNVLGAGLDELAFTDYTTQVAIVQQILAMSLWVMWTLVGLGVYWLGWNFASLMVGFGVMTFSWLSQEFVRRAFFSQGNVTSAIWNDTLSYGVQVVVLLLLQWSGKLSLGSAILVISVSSAIAYAAGLRKLTGRHYFQIRAPHGAVRVTVIRHWQFGKWLLGSSLLAWNAGGCYLVLLMVGEKAAGAWRGIEVLVGPIQLLMAGLDGLLPTRVAHDFKRDGLSGVQKTLLQVYGISIPLLIIFCVPMSLFSRKAIEIVLGVQYVEYQWLLNLILLYTSIGFLQQPLSLALRGIGHASVIFRGQIISTAIALPAGLATGLIYGVVGAAVGLSMHFVILNLALWLHWRRLIACPEETGSPDGGISSSFAEGSEAVSWTSGKGPLIAGAKPQS
jgi:O-antigen/teichoic acid export membrane protein